MINDINRKCVICDEPISGQKMMYCSNACKQKGHYNRSKNQTNTFHSQSKRFLIRKMHLIDLRGGKCECCPYNNNVAALEFHHIDPNEKRFTLDSRNLSNKSMKEILIEFEKCKVFCANCHREHHNEELDIENVRKLIQEDKIKLPKPSVKPKCVDCGTSINYTYTRCRVCADKSKRKIKWPTLLEITSEFQEHGIKWCMEKYKVSGRTIERWRNPLKNI